MARVRTVLTASRSSPVPCAVVVVTVTPQGCRTRGGGTLGRSAGLLVCGVLLLSSAGFVVAHKATRPPDEGWRLSTAFSRRSGAVPLGQESGHPGRGVAA